MKSDQDIQEILPKREQYLVSTSEFDDIKARLQSVLSNLRKGDKKEGPTLRKREADDRTDSGVQTTGEPSKDDGEDKPPVLKRRD